MTSLKAARVATAAKITDAVAGFPGVSVLAYEPPTVSGDMVTVATAGAGPTDWLLTVRVYVGAVQSAEGQDLLDDLVEAVDTVGEQLGSPVPRPQWSAVYDEVKDAFVMATTLAYPREDF